MSDDEMVLKYNKLESYHKNQNEGSPIWER